MRTLVRVIAIVLVSLPGIAAAVQVGGLETRWDWDLQVLRFDGNKQVATRTLRDVMITAPRQWYAPWRPFPPFDPSTFEADVVRVLQYYRSQGYYRARVGYDLELPASGTHLTAVVYIDEDHPVDVTSVVVNGPPAEEAERLHALLPLEPGDVFTEDAYHRGEALLRTDLRERGFARATIQRAADVNVDEERVDVSYQVDPGPPSVFGTVTIRGNQRVTEDIIRRELAFAPGDPFRESTLETTRAHLASLNLFRTIRLDESPGPSPTVDIQITVTEVQPRDIRLGLGYDTEEQVRALASWRDYNFLGGGRQLGVTARASFIRYTLLGDFLQPHTPTPNSRFRVVGLAQREDEDGYRLDRARLLLRAEWDPKRWLSTYLFYRIEYDSLAQVPAAVIAAVPNAVPANALQSGVGGTIEFSHVDDPIDPSRGFTLKGGAEIVGGILGGDVGFLRVTGEARGWIPLPLDSLLALRVRLGSAAPLGGTRDIPLYERFYAGGTGSVRGYDRRRVGPLADDDPIGGRSLTEASVEFRHHFTSTITGVAFLDAGQVDRRDWRVILNRLALGTGIGARYRSPVGPIELDIGIPLDAAPGDSHWQIHVSLGGAF